ncbi:MAG: DUF58 domain-containing protein [Sedimentisphaerales bacterium]|nr:DUF58 domain-containing protein [Sedimentisphaerales bacterium]
MAGSTRDYLDPIFLSKLANMELVARCAVEGFFSGLHPSPFQGFSVEYSDHREYYPGDEVKFVDWKIFARTDRLCIKRFHQETNTCVYILLDVSKSMAFAGGRAVRKVDYASFLAAALSYLMLKQGDSAALVQFAERIRAQIPPASRRTHLNVILTALQRAHVGGRTNLTGVLHTVAETTKRRGLVILISDLLDDEGDISKGLAHLKFLKHDVIVFHVLDHQELELDYEGLIEFEDMESKDKVRAFPQSIRSGYQQRVGEFLDDVRKTLGKNDVDYCLLDTSEPLDRALIAYLVKRKRLM